MVRRSGAETQSRSLRNVSRPRLRLGMLCLLLGFFLSGCGQPQLMYATLVADGQEQWLQVTNPDLTVRELVDAAGLELGPLDRIEPDLYVIVTDGMEIVVTRVTEEFVTERHVLPFGHQTVKSEGVPEGERRLLRAGSNGDLEITYLVTLEDEVEVSREEVSRQVLAQPVDETVLVGVQPDLSAVPISGTIVYLSGGNAWIMRQSTELRRNITGSSDLDGRVFSLSEDGTRLAFTRSNPGDDSAPINSLWMARTSLVGEEPEYLGVTNVVWAGWAPDEQRLAYSTAERTGGVPGWKAKTIFGC